MSEDLRRELQLLEQDYPGMPLAVQRVDLQKINDLRTRLDLPLVDSHLVEITPDPPQLAPDPVGPPFPSAEPDEQPDHAEARAIYRTYRQRIEALRPHREYADRVARATAGDGMTPVRPLATMGTAGGPLLCDHCEKPIVLEGGDFHGVYADEAWRSHPRDFQSFILGGMVVERQTNGTLRIYHGYPGRDNTACCNVASREDEHARAAYDPGERTAKRRLLWAFIEDEFSARTERQRQDLFDDVLKTLFAYDPGIGVNRPTT